LRSEWPIRLQYPGFTSKFANRIPGDIDPEGQRASLPWKSRQNAGVLKVPHHGAAGLDKEFLLEVRPKIAVVSCGWKNRYGHPAAETVELLKRAGCRVARTDVEGAVRVELGTMELATER
jgi:competence protein ComEC